MSEGADAAAILAAINAQFTTLRAVELDQAAAQTGDHILVFVSRRFMPGTMSDGSAAFLGGRVVTRYIAKTVTNLRNLRTKTAAALEEQSPGGVGPFAFEGEQESLTFDSDLGGWYVAADSWVY